jgi:integrase
LAWWLEQKRNPDREVRKEEVIAPPPPTLGDWLERWLKSIRKSIGAGAFRQYESHVREHLTPSLGHRLLIELERDPQLIEDAMERWKRRDGRGGDLSASFVKKIWCTLRAALNGAVKNKKITSNPCKATDPPKVECKEMRALSPAQVKQYVVAFDKTAIGAAIALALGSGCRCGELLACVGGTWTLKLARFASNTPQNVWQSAPSSVYATS